MQETARGGLVGRALGAVELQCRGNIYTCQGQSDQFELCESEGFARECVLDREVGRVAAACGGLRLAK